jgi:hypothetical protein
MDISKITPGGAFAFPSARQYGALSVDGNVLADVTTATSSQQFCMDIAIRKSNAANAALFSGDYIVSEIRSEDALQYTGTEVNRTLVHLDGQGAGTYQTLAKSNNGTLDSGTFTYTVSPDGTFTLMDPVEGTDYGIISRDGNTFMIIDTDSTDGNVAIMIGVKKSSAMVASNMIGTYNLFQMGANQQTGEGITWTPDTEFGTLAIATVGTAMYTPISGTSTLSSPNTASYTGSADGTFTITGQDNVGIASSDGGLMVMSDTNMTTDNYMNLSIGIKIQSR